MATFPLQECAFDGIIVVDLFEKELAACAPTFMRLDAPFLSDFERAPDSSDICPYHKLHTTPIAGA